MTTLLEALIDIIIINIVLSGDNAVVIGMASRSLPAATRRKAIVYGSLGAIALRVVFTAAAALLLNVPYLRAAGAVLLVWIAWKLVRPDDGEAAVDAPGSLWGAVRTIIAADLVMSLDNILAIGGAAHGQLGLMLVGLLISIPIIMVGSELVARLLGRYPLLLYVGVFVLVHTAVSMFFEDSAVRHFGGVTAPVVWALAVAITAAISLRARNRPPDPEPVTAGHAGDWRPARAVRDEGRDAA